MIKIIVIVTTIMIELIKMIKIRLTIIVINTCRIRCEVSK